MAQQQPRTGNRHTKWIVAGIVVAIVGVTGISLGTNLARERQKEAAVQERLERVEIVSGNTAHVFQVEVMRNDTERARGLMFRQFMPQDRGMLFDFERDTSVSMWMRNTYIPLDMLFIRSDGRVHRVHEKAQPLDETAIPAGAPVRYVLEINGGVAAKLGIKAGDLVKHNLIKP
ncbi:MAG: DUF192 domain-containing protein [Beijerinckiaceae bacterium]